eukprot:GHRR01016492.1.p1 GENE.GHRR01016492.1~~GHRR01016492.1.p1  ORF type:complete len:382 (+),score=119.76 GHRR01016492.1:189-1334(+)
MGDVDPLDALPDITTLSISNNSQQLRANVESVVATFDLGSPDASASDPIFNEELASISLADPAPADVGAATAETTVSATEAATVHQQNETASTDDVASAADPATFTAPSAADPAPAQVSSASVLEPDYARPMATAPSQGEAAVKVWVKDPEKVERSRIGITFTSYVTYLVRTECSPGVFLNAASATSSTAPAQSSRASTQVFEVRRRFSDFDVFHRLLKSHYRGYFIPPLPDKAFLESKLVGGNFLQVRKVDLQAYTCSVANHPVLQRSEEIRIFLTYSDDLSSSARWQQMVQRPAPMDSLLGMLGQQRNSATAASVCSPDLSAPCAASAAGSGEVGVLGANPLGMFMRVKHSLKGVVQPKPKQEMPADEIHLRQAKEWFM